MNNSTLYCYRVVILDLYVPNGEFDLVSTGTGHDDLSVADVDGTVKDYRKLKFHLTFRRRWPFYGQNLVGGATRRFLPLVSVCVCVCVCVCV